MGTHYSGAGGGVLVFDLQGGASPLSPPCPCVAEVLKPTPLTIGGRGVGHLGGIWEILAGEGSGF